MKISTGVFYPKLLTVIVFAVVMFATSPLQASRILVIGDSWGVAASKALRVVLLDKGSSETVANIAVNGETAANLNTPAWFARINAALEENDDATLVHLSIGGNDILGQWNGNNFVGGWNGTFSSQEEETLIAEIMVDIEAIVDHILIQRPDIRIFWSSYDFPRPLEIGSPEQVNQVMQRFAVHAQALADTKSASLTFGNYNGLMQVEYGFSGGRETRHDPTMPIAPGDPSLPNPVYPGPANAFVDLIHLTTKAYLVLAERQYDEFYANALGEGVFHINAGLNDAWYNPATNGQGFFVTVYPDRGRIFLAWFTYDTELPPAGEEADLGYSGHRWITALGDYDDGLAVLEVYNSHGGIFNSGEEVTSDAYGTIVLEFTSCTIATVDYDLPSVGVVGEIEIQRIANDNVALCEALNEAQ